MKIYKFIDACRNDNIKISDISEISKRKYGIEIAPESIVDKNFLSDNMEKIIIKLKKRNVIENTDEDYNGERCLKNSIFDNLNLNKIKYSDEESKLIDILNEIILNPDQYENDIFADIYMGYLYAETEFTFILNDINKEVWESDKDCNNSNDRENEREHYPYAKKRDVLNDGIPGGGKDFHELMITNSNMVLFDIGTETTSLKKYGFPKTYLIYEKLRESSIDNLFLLEKSQGIGYTNQLFSYLMTFKKKSDFEITKKIIEYGIEIVPIFLRKQIVDIVWCYLRKYNYSRTSFQIIEEVMNHYVYVINQIYTGILEFAWYTYYSAIKYGGKDEQLYWMEMRLEQNWENYYNDDKAYKSWITSENLSDWRGIESVENCFLRNENKYDFYVKTTDVIIETVNGGYKYLTVSKPANALGEKIYKRTLQKMNRLSLCDEEKLLDIYYRLRNETYEELKTEETNVWKDKDFKIPKEKLEPMHIYAILHSLVVSKLN